MKFIHYTFLYSKYTKGVSFEDKFLLSHVTERYRIMLGDIKYSVTKFVEANLTFDINMNSGYIIGLGGEYLGWFKTCTLNIWSICFNSPSIRIVLFTLNVKHSQPGPSREEKILKDLFRQLLLEKKMAFSIRVVNLIFKD